MGSKNKKNMRRQAKHRVERHKEERADEATSSCAAAQLPSYISYSIAGGIAPEALFLPLDREVVPNADIAIHEASAPEDDLGGDEGPAIISTPRQSIETHPAPQGEHAHSPSFHSFTDHNTSFTFGTVASMIPGDVRSAPLAFAAPTTFKVPESRYSQPRSDTSALEVRSIVDVLEERGYQDTNVTTTSANEAEPSKQPIDAQLSLYNSATIELETQPDTISIRSTSPTMEQADDMNALVPLYTSQCGLSDSFFSHSLFEMLLYVPKSSDHITLHGAPKTSWSTVDAWVRREAERLLQANINHSAPALFEDASRTASKNMPMVPYHVDKLSGGEQQHTSPRRTARAETSLPNWHSKRIFFADPCGYTRLVDCTQTLYDVDVMMDDGASDFDSIASPMKLDPRVQPIPALSTTTSSEESDENVDLDGLSNLVGVDCVFHTEKPQMESVDFKPATTQSFLEDEDVIDPCLAFCILQRHASMVHLDIGRSIQAAASFVEIQGVTSEYHDTESYHHTADAFLDTSTLTSVDTAYALQSPAVIASEPKLPDYEDHVAVKGKAAPPTKPFSSNWASELACTKLGTESLLTFLECLDYSEDGSTTRTAIAAAFLKLVNLEREKLGQRPLPTSYTASAVTASKILPYTIFLGATSLCSFIEQLSFEEDDGATLG